MGRRISSLPQGAVLFPLCVFIVAVFYSIGAAASHNEKAVLVVGSGDCADCAEKNVEKGHAFSGLKVTIECKAASGQLTTRGASELDKDGKFSIELSGELVDNAGLLKEDCYAQFHSASHQPCPAHNNDLHKIVLKSIENGKHTFTTAGKLSFNSQLCTSAFLWKFFKHPPLPPYHKTFPPKIPFPPIYKKPCPPIYMKPMPPPVPVYKPPAPVYNPPSPVYKPPPVYESPPVYKPPVYKSPPVYKPPVYKPPVYKPPVYKKKPCPPLPPIYKKPMPPFYKHPPLPPMYKKPWPPMPKFPPFPPMYKKPWPKYPPHMVSKHLSFPPKA